VYKEGIVLEARTEKEGEPHVFCQPESVSPVDLESRKIECEFLQFKGPKGTGKE
jgi:hypothetical protein